MTHDSSGKILDVEIDVFKLGLVSLLTDLSSEIIFAVFAVFFTTFAGASAFLLGLVEGLADFSACSLDYLAGWLSDRTGQRKVYALSGYAFSTFAKGILLLSSSVMSLASFRVIERIGKSVRGPPRDAWLAAIAEPSIRGYSFGIHKALDKVGAVLGPLFAYGMLSLRGESANTYRTLFAIALVPAILSVLMLGVIKDRPATPLPRESLNAVWKLLSGDFKRYLISAAIFSLAYFSFGFLLLRAYQIGFAVRDVVLLYGLFNFTFVLSAPLIGRCGDRWGRGWLIVLGYLTYLLVCVGFALAQSQGQVVALFALYGVYYAIDEAQSKAFIADLEAERRASAMGVYNFVTGLIYVPASVLAGALWSRSYASTFFVAAGLCVSAMIVFVILRPDRMRVATAPIAKAAGHHSPSTRSLRSPTNVR